ncbi:MAG TPA: GAF domain-containing protein [Anaerolineae bacterium]|nr:GAF domain-containing protein [Anaerolineae bacterium]HQH39807.1 GAF domain-containing protein [Anaerolineae bacterium]
MNGASEQKLPTPQEWAAMRARLATLEAEYATLSTRYAREQAQRRLSDALRQVAQMISSTLDQNRLLALILEQLKTVVPYDRATVLLLQDDQFTLAAGYDNSEQEVTPFTLPRDCNMFITEMLDSKSPVLIQDATHDSRWYFSTAMQTARSFISAPLLLQDRPIGALSVGRRDAVAYTEADVEAVFAFAGQIAIAVHNAQLYTQAQERAQRLSLVYDIVLDITSTLDLNTILTTACRKLVESIPRNDHSGLAFFDEERQYAEVIAEYPDRGALGMHLSLADNWATQHVIETLQPVVIDDAQHDPLMQPVWGEMRTLGVCSILIIPVIIKGRIVGTLGLDAFTVAYHFLPSEIALAQTVAGQLGVAIENARLYSSVQQELSERRRVEEALRQYTLELEASNAELDAFAHTVAHDLKNPLSALIGFSVLLTSRFPKMPPEQVLEDLQHITAIGYKMISIIHELLLLASVRKMEEVPTSPLDMATIVAESLARLAGLQTDVHAEIELPETWPIAVGYAPWIEEVWTNYISNALKYGGCPDEDIPPRVTLGCDAPQDGKVRFWVRDDGCGLRLEEQGRLFAPFTRLYQMRAEGHGLGLSIVHRIIEKLNGDVGVESEEGRGSLFWFTLPAPVPAESSNG